MKAARPASAATWWLIGLAAGIVLYGATMSPGLSWGDSGEAQLHALRDGWLLDGQICRSHVTYFALTRGLARVTPFGTAVCANLIAALFGAVTVANAAWLMAVLTRANVATLCGTLMLLVSHTLWQMSASAEVVTLSTALLTAELMAFERFARTGRARFLIGACLANGLGVSTHNMAMLTWPVYAVLAVMYRSRWRAVRTRTWGAAAAAWLAGVAPILLPGLAYARAGHGLADTIRSALIGRYGGSVFNVDYLVALGLKSVAYVVLNFPTPLLALWPIGAWCVLRSAKRPIGPYLVGAAGVMALFAARYDVADQYTFFVHAHVFIALFCAIGIQRWTASRSRVRAWVAVGFSLTGPLVYALAPAVTPRTGVVASWLPPRNLPYRDPYRWFLRPWRVGDHSAAQFARETLDELPDGALLWADSTPYPPIAFIQVTESRRRDVRLDGRPELQPWLPSEPDVAAMRRRHLSDGTWFSTSDLRAYLPDWLRDRDVTYEPFGHVFRIHPGPKVRS